MSLKSIVFVLVFSWGSSTYSTTQEYAAHFFHTLHNIGLPFNQDPQLPRQATREALQDAKMLRNAIENASPQFAYDQYTDTYIQTLIVGMNGIIHWIERRMEEPANN